jgi:hypothetical protein
MHDSITLCGSAGEDVTNPGTADLSKILSATSSYISTLKELWGIRKILAG